MGLEETDVIPRIILGNITGNDDEQTIQMVKTGIDILNTIISSQEFKKEFLEFPFIQTNGQSNQELWNLFIKSPIIINVEIKDLGFRADHLWHTIGREDSNHPDTVFVNSYFVKTSYMLGDNALHEVWHMLGLSHLHPTDSTSVPYGNNTLYEKVAAKLGIDENI
jgi:hypothetical protein